MASSINYDELLNLIRRRLAEIVTDEQYGSYYDGYKIIVTSEQQFIKIKDKAPKTIYMTVKFGNATMYFDQTVLPGTLTAISENNHSFVCKTLLLEYANRYNLNDYQDNINEIYSTPTTLQNFNEVYSGFRSVMSMDITFVIAKNVNFYKLDYNFKSDDDNDAIENVKALTTGVEFNNTIDSQAFYGTHNFATSIAKIASISISTSMYFFSNSPLLNKCLDILKLSGEAYNSYFLTSDREFKSGITYYKKTAIENTSSYEFVEYTPATGETNPAYLGLYRAEYFPTTDPSVESSKTYYQAVTDTATGLSYFIQVSNPTSVSGLYEKYSATSSLSDNINNSINLTIKFDTTNVTANFKLISMAMTRDIGTIPVVALSFAK